MQDERAAAAVTAVPENVRFTTFHLIDAEGRGLSGGTAVIATLEILERTAWLGKALGARPCRPVVQMLYALLAGSRGVVGKLVKDAPGPERWP